MLKEHYIKLIANQNPYKYSSCKISVILLGVLNNYEQYIYEHYPYEQYLHIYEHNIS